MSPQQLDFSNVLRRPIRGDPGISRDQEPQAGQVMMSVVKSVSSLRTGVICSARSPSRDPVPSAASTLPPASASRELEIGCAGSDKTVSQFQPPHFFTRYASLWLAIPSTPRSQTFR
eukprot:2206190-Rhodomonas_salina.3